MNIIVQLFILWIIVYCIKRQSMTLTTEPSLQTLDVHSLVMCCTYLHIYHIFFACLWDFFLFWQKLCFDIEDFVNTLQKYHFDFPEQADTSNDSQRDGASMIDRKQWALTMITTKWHLRTCMICQRQWTLPTLNTTWRPAWSLKQWTIPMRTTRWRPTYTFTSGSHPGK